MKFPTILNNIVSIVAIDNSRINSIAGFMNNNVKEAKKMIRETGKITKIFHSNLGKILNDNATKYPKLAKYLVDRSVYPNSIFENLNMNEDVYTESSGVKSLDFNWWGSDEDPADLGLSNYEKINNWLYLDITPEYLALNINEDRIITCPGNHDIMRSKAQGLSRHLKDNKNPDVNELDNTEITKQGRL